MKHVVIGTAGHIDHGKTALIQALTGRNTDRLAEEQRRGLTIDLGFTWFDLPDGTRCGVIDVPGHEKFIGNMAAGVVGMDLVLAVVAADDGIMPQTREHLDILSLLGVERAVLVVTKCDLVEQDWLDLLEAEIREEGKGTLLETAPAVRVSSKTGEGIPALKNLIARMVREEVPSRDTRGIPRLPVDRVFPIPGFGTVVTGTLLSGTLSKGDTLEAWPVGKLCRIRNMQVHERDRDVCEAGERTALNLTGIPREALYRGCVLAPPGTLALSDRIDVRLRVLASSRRIVRNRERLHLYIGTSAVLCRAVLLDREDLGPGEEGLAQLMLEEKLAVLRGDRFVVRFYSPVETIGGGQVLEAHPRKRKRFQPDVLRELRRKESGTLGDIAETYIRDAWDAMISLSDLARAAGCERSDLLPWLEALEGEGSVEMYPLSREGYCWHRDAAYEVRQAIAAALGQFHRQRPYRYGLPRETVRHTFLRRMPPGVTDRALGRMVREGHFRLHGDCLMLPDYEIPRDGVYQAVEGLLVSAFERAGWQFLRFSEIDRGEYPEETVMDILNLLIGEGTCARVGTTLPLYTLRRFPDRLAEQVRDYFRTEERITIKQIKEMCGTSRKCARSLVEYLDEHQITRKAGAETERVAY